MDSRGLGLVGCIIWLLGGRGGEQLQVCDGDGGEADGFHAAISVCKGVELDLHLAGLWAVEVPFVEEAFDICFYEEGELEGQAYASVMQPC